MAILFQKGGKPNKKGPQAVWDTTVDAYHKVNNKVDDALWMNSKFYSADWKYYRDAAEAAIKETPLMNSEPSKEDVNELKYVGDLASRLGNAPITSSDISNMFEDNTPRNLINKVGTMTKLPIYRNDMDSIQKYLPKTYNKYHMSKFKYLLKDKPIQYKE